MGYSNGILESDEKGGSGERGEQGLPGIGFKLTDDGNFDIDGKRLTNISKPVDGGDATTKAYVDGEIGHHTGNMYHLRQSFTFYDSSGTELALSTDSITGLVTDYKHGYYKIPKSGDDNYFSIKIRNNLPQSTYSALFYLYGYRNNSIMSGVDLGPILFSVDGTNYNILKYDDDDSTETRNHTKGIIWFTSDGRAGSIELGFRFFDKSITHFVILSRCVEGKVNLGFSSNIFNVSSTVGDIPLYFENVVMNNRSIKNLGGPTDDGDATNKKYVDTVNARQDTAINDKTSKSELVNFSSINTGLGYNNPAKSSFSYVMNKSLIFLQKNYLFDGSIVSSIANTGSNANSTTLNIPYKGKYKLIFKEILASSVGPGSFKIDLSWTESSGIKVANVYSQNFNFPPADFVEYHQFEHNNDLFVDYENSNLKIYVTGTLHLTAGVPNSKSFFGLYLDSDVLRKREAVKKYLKLNGNNKMRSDLDIDGNHILKVENLTDYKDTDPYDYRVKDVKSVVNKEYLNENFMKKVDKDGKEYYDLKGNIIKNSQQYFDGLYTDDNDLVSKKYVDTENAKQDTTINSISSISSYNTNLIKALQSSKADQSYVDDNFLNLDGSKSMKGNLNTDGNYIDGLPELVEDDTSDETLAKIKGRAIDFGYFKKQRDYLVRRMVEEDGDLLPKDGSEPMGGNLSMTDSSGNKHSIIGLKDPQPSDSSYAASVNFVNTTVNGIIDKKIKDSEAASIESTIKQNVFEKVMNDNLFKEDDGGIKFINTINYNLLHKINQMTYLFTIDYDSDKSYYSARLSIDLRYLNTGTYTMVFEMKFASNIDQDKVTVNAVSGTFNQVSTNTKIINFDYGYYSRSIINFHKWIKNQGIDDLDIDLNLYLKSSISPIPNKTPINVIVYGVRGSHTDVPIQIWDRVYYIDDNKIHFEAPIDMVDKDIENVNNLSINNELNMNNTQIKKLGDGIENSDGVNVKQLNDLKTNVTGEFGKVNPVLKNNSDLIKFIYRNLIRNDSKLFLIKELYFPDSIEGRTQNNYTYQTNGDNKGDVTFYLTFVHKATTSDSVIIALHWDAGRPIYIFVSKSSVVASENLLINEPSLKSYNIPSYYIGKQVYLWITIQNDLIQINFSGSRAISVTHPFIFHKDANLRRIDVSDSPFTIQRGLITKNIYDVNSDAYKDVREYEISEGTFVSAV